MGDTCTCLRVSGVKMLHTQQILKYDGAFPNAP